MRRALFVLLAACAARGEVDQARETTAGAGASTGETAAIYQRSYDAEAIGDFGAALDATNALGPPFRDEYVAELRRAWLLYRLNQSVASIAAYRRAASREPASIEARLGLLLPLATLERWKELETASQDVLDRDPENYTAMTRIALALRRQKRYAEAEVVYRKLLSQYPANVDLRTELGWVLFEMGRASLACNIFEGALRIAPKHPGALEGLRASSSGITGEPRNASSGGR